MLLRRAMLGPKSTQKMTRAWVTMLMPTRRRFVSCALCQTIRLAFVKIDDGPEHSNQSYACAVTISCSITATAAGTATGKSRSTCLCAAACRSVPSVPSDHIAKSLRHRWPVRTILRAQEKRRQNTPLPEVHIEKAEESAVGWGGLLVGSAWCTKICWCRFS